MIDMSEKAVSIAKYLFDLYKKNKDKEEVEVNSMIATTVAFAADIDYSSFRVFYTDDSLWG